jgi:hypothetical protein
MFWFSECKSLWDVELSVHCPSKADKNDALKRAFLFSLLALIIHCQVVQRLGYQILNLRIMVRVHSWLQRSAVEKRYFDLGLVTVRFCRFKSCLRFDWSGGIGKHAKKKDSSRFASATRLPSFLKTGCSADGYTGVFWIHVFGSSNLSTQTNISS